MSWRLRRIEARRREVLHDVQMEGRQDAHLPVLQAPLADRLVSQSHPSNPEAALLLSQMRGGVGARLLEAHLEFSRAESRCIGQEARLGARQP